MIFALWFFVKLFQSSVEFSFDLRFADSIVRNFPQSAISNTCCISRFTRRLLFSLFLSVRHHHNFMKVVGSSRSNDAGNLNSDPQ